MKLVLISQDGCNPCKNVKNILDGEEAFYEYVNITNDNSAIDKYQIMSTPVLILFDGEKEVERVNGDRNRGAIYSLIEQIND